MFIILYKKELVHLHVWFYVHEPYFLLEMFVATKFLLMVDVFSCIFTSDNMFFFNTIINHTTCEVSFRGKRALPDFTFSLETIETLNMYHAHFPSDCIHYVMHDNF